MADVAKSRGIKIDAAKMSELLDVPVLFTVGNKNEGIDDLLKAAVDLAESDKPTARKRRVRYRADIEKAIRELESVLTAEFGSALPYNPRWTALKLIEDDTIVKERVRQMADGRGKRVFAAVQTQRETLMGLFDEEPEILTTDERYGFIAGIVKEVHTTAVQQRVDISRNIDLVLTNGLWDFPSLFCSYGSCSSRPSPWVNIPWSG